MKQKLFALTFIALFAASLSHQTLAQSPQKETTSVEQAAASTTFSDNDSVDSSSQKIFDIMKRAQRGSQTITLGNEGSLKLPENMLFIGKDDANTLMKLMGNSEDNDRYGIIMPADDDEEKNWLIDVTYTNSGYIKDDEAQNWDTKELMAALKQSDEEQNKIRLAQGMPAIEMVGWVETPHYDAQTHRLVWASDIIEKGAPEKGHIVNYHAYLLGRKGYIDLTLITDTSTLHQDKTIINTLIKQTDFNEGLRYTDFDATTDKMADYGIAALIGGIAAKKLGLFALIGAFVIKFAKLIIVGVIGLVTVFKRLLARKSAQDFRQPENHIHFDKHD